MMRLKGHHAKHTMRQKFILLKLYTNNFSVQPSFLDSPAFASLDPSQLGCLSGLYFLVNFLTSLPKLITPGDKAASPNAI